MSILSHFLDENKPSGQKGPSLRRIPPTLQQFRAERPVDAWGALKRNAEAFEAYQREQARASRPRTVRPERSGFAVLPNRRAA